MRRWLATVAFSCAACAGCPPTPRVVTAPRPTLVELSPARVDGRLRPGCLGEELFVDVSEESPDACPGFREAFARELDRALPERFCAWSLDLLGQGACSAASPPLAVARATVEAVFAPRTDAQGCAVHSGHLRFHRVQLHALDASGTERRVTVPDAAAGMVIPWMRALAVKVQADLVATGSCARAEPAACPPAPEPQATAFEVGRECPARPLDLGAEAPASLQQWHLRAIDAQPAQGRPVRVALVDTGMGRAVPAEEVVRSQHADLPRDVEEQTHPHGAAMAALVREAAPSAEVHSYRAWDEQGRGLTKYVARAIEHAVYDAPLELPLVVNLSLGWSPEYTHQALLPGFEPGSGFQDPGSAGATFKTTRFEGAVGEPVKYALELLRRDRPRAIAVAAAGNRPAPSARTAGWAVVCANQPPPPAPGTCVRIESVRYEAALFYPAEWANQDTRVFPRDVPRRLALAVGALDAEHTLSTLARPSFPPGATTPSVVLTAPGDHVYVRTAGRARAAEPDACTEAEVVRGPMLPPFPMTGSSVSAALVSASLAQLQAIAGPLEHDDLVRLAVASARPNRPSTRLVGADTHGTRRPSQLRAAALMGEVDCADDRDALLALPEALAPWLDVPVLSMGCQAALDRIPEREPRNGVPDGYPFHACAPLSGSATGPLDTTCTSLNGAVLPCLDQMAAGPLGPQPIIIGCSDCRATRTGANVFVTDGEIAKAQGVTTLTQPQLLTYDRNGKFIRAFALANPPTLKPGQSFKLEWRDLTPPSGWAKTEIQFVARMPGTEPVLATAPLRNDFEPIP